MTKLDLLLKSLQPKRTSGGNGILLGGTICIAVGLAAGMLLAPRAGKVSRLMIERKISEMVKRMTSQINEMNSDNDLLQEEAERS